MLVDNAQQILARNWNQVCRLAEAVELEDWLKEPTLLENIRRSVNSKTKTYRYVLPTQVAAKLADPLLDCRCLQAARGGAGAFDARGIAHAVIVPFDQANDNVLGGSQEPYVNNPLRVPEVSRKHRAAQRDREGWDRLCEVLDAIETHQDKNFTLAIFKQVLTEIYRRLSLAKVVYPTPRRVSLTRAIDLIKRFSAEHSGGDRLLALTSALFTVIGSRFGLYSEVRRAKITAADQPRGMLADLECVSKHGEVVMAVEVKDRFIKVSQVRAKMQTIRERQVSETFFIAQGVENKEQRDLERLIDHEFTSGHNIYVTDLISLSRAALSLLGEAGRRRFLAETAVQLDRYQSDITHRRAWASLLATV